MKEEEKLEMFFLTKLNDIFTALLFCRALNANIFVAGLVSSWAGWGEFLCRFWIWVFTWKNSKISTNYISGRH